MKRVGVILASVREGRAGEKIATWFMEETGKLNLDIRLALIDLKEINLPSMNEPVSPKSGSEYVFEHTKEWSQIVSGFDGFVILTPEYNHGYPGSLKNALDYLYKEWVGKPVGLVGYGGRGAPFSRKYLKDVFKVIELVPLEEEVSIRNIWKAFDKNGKPLSEFVEGSIEKMLLQMINFFEKS